MPELAAGIALLLVGMVAVPGQVAGFAAVVAALLSLPLGLLAVLGNVASSAAVIAGFNNKEKKQTKTIKPYRRRYVPNHTAHTLRGGRSLPTQQCMLVRRGSVKYLPSS